MPEVEPHTNEELLDTLMGRLRAARPAEHASSAAHIVGYAKELFDHREDLGEALDAFHRLGADASDEMFLAAFERAFRRARPALANAPHRPELLTIWMEILINTIEEMNRVRSGRPIPFHHYLDAEDIAVMDEDRLEGDVGARAIAAQS